MCSVSNRQEWSLHHQNWVLSFLFKYDWFVCSSTSLYLFVLTQNLFTIPFFCLLAVTIVCSYFCWFDAELMVVCLCYQVCGYHVVVLQLSINFHDLLTSHSVIRLQGIMNLYHDYWKFGVLDAWPQALSVHSICFLELWHHLDYVLPQALLAWDPRLMIMMGSNLWSY